MFEQVSKKKDLKGGKERFAGGKERNNSNNAFRGRIKKSFAFFLFRSFKKEDKQGDCFKKDWIWRQRGL